MFYFDHIRSDQVFSDDLVKRYSDLSDVVVRQPSAILPGSDDHIFVLYVVIRSIINVLDAQLQNSGLISVDIVLHIANKGGASFAFFKHDLD